MTEPRFLCDEMLKGLGKWLRAAGYDTLVAAPGANDRDLLASAIEENRILLTRDRSFPERKGSAGVVFLLDESGLENWVRELNRRLSREQAIDWLHAPFTRCLVCNGELAAGPGPYAGQMPDYVSTGNVPSFHCPDCARAYWRGGHVQRMRRRLAQWNGL